MRHSRRHRTQTLAPPAGGAEELAAAIEAATGEEARVPWTDPLGGSQLRDGMDRLLMAARPDRGLEALYRAGVLEAYLPEVVAMVGFGEGIRHKDVWGHTKKVILRAPARLEVRWAALLHDIGKVPTRRFESNGQVTFIGHPEVGARMFDGIARRIPFGDELRERVRFLIASHLRAAAYDESWTDSAVRRFTRDTAEALEDLLDLSRADITSKYVEKVERGTRQINRLEERVAALKELDARPKPLPKGLGTAIIEQLGVPAGPELGRLIRWLTSEVEAGRLDPQREYEYYLPFVAKEASL